MATVPKIAEDLRQRRAALAGVSFSWILNRIDVDLLEEMEHFAERGDGTLLELLNEMDELLRDSDEPIDGVALESLSTLYGEALVYFHLKDRISLTRVPRSGDQSPDFKAKLDGTEFFIELKTLSVYQGRFGQERIMDTALAAQIELAQRLKRESKAPIKVASAESEIQVMKASKDRRATILEVLDKAYRNIKKGQFSAGPSFLFLNLEMLSLFDETPVSLACCSYQAGPVPSCVSGELWHVAFGQPEHLILDMPEFEGKPSVVGALGEKGILQRHPELLGLGILVADLHLRHKLYLLHRSVCPSGPSGTPYLGEDTYDNVAATLSDTRNDELNSAAWKYLSRN